MKLNAHINLVQRVRIGGAIHLLIPTWFHVVHSNTCVLQFPQSSETQELAYSCTHYQELYTPRDNFEYLYNNNKYLSSRRTGCLKNRTAKDFFTKWIWLKFVGANYTVKMRWRADHLFLKNSRQPTSAMPNLNSQYQKIS